MEEEGIERPISKEAKKRVRRNSQRLQRRELEFLSTIYSYKLITFKNGRNILGSLNVDIELPDKYLITYGEEEIKNFEVNFLPPIKLKFEQYPSYPASRPPGFILQCSWLTVYQLSNLCEQMDSIWLTKKGLCIINEWVTFLKKNTLTLLGLSDVADITDIIKIKTCLESIRNTPAVEKEINSIEIRPKHIFHLPQNRKGKDFDNRAINDFNYTGDLPTYLKDFDIECKLNKLNQILTECNVCTDEKRREEFFQFINCGHLICVDCVKDYFELQIKEGNVQQLKCMMTKCENVPYPNQVLEIVGEELFKRYDELLLSSALGTMEDVMYCPQMKCQAAVIIEPDLTDVMCSICQYYFCTSCKGPKHGFNDCKIREEEIKKVAQAYNEGDEIMKKNLESVYGKKKLKKILEEGLSEDWLITHSKPCPKCKTSIEKIDGCNKMTCRNCNFFFCWLCRTILDKKNPYSHFNNKDSSCFNQLFPTILPQPEEEWQFGQFL